MTTIRITVDGRSHDATIARGDDGLQVTVDGRSFRVNGREPDDGDGRTVAVRLDDGAPVEVTRLDLERVRVDDLLSTYRIESITAGAGAGLVGAEGARIHPPMPGKVVALRVRAGEAVEAGQVLLVLEAMKMQNEVTSPAAGTVTEVRTKAGATVDTRDVLVVLGPPDAAATDGHEKEVAA